MSLRKMNNNKKIILHTRTWEDLYICGETWEDELLFEKDEIRFLHDLVSKHLLSIIAAGDYKKVQELSNRLTSLSLRTDDLLKKIKQHLSTLSVLMEGVFEDEEIMDNHQSLQKFVHRYVRDIRQMKSEAFKLIERVVRSEKFQHLLSA